MTQIIGVLAMANKAHTRSMGVAKIRSQENLRAECGLSVTEMSFGGFYIFVERFYAVYVPFVSS